MHKERAELWMNQAVHVWQLFKYKEEVRVLCAGTGMPKKLLGNAWLEHRAGSWTWLSLDMTP